MVFPASYEATKVVQPGKETFDFPASTVATQGPPILGSGFSAIAFVGCNEVNAIVLLQLLVQRITVVGQIAHQIFRRVRSEGLIEGRSHQPGFMRCSAGHVHGDRNTMAVCNCHDLAPFAALRFTNSRAPFLAPLKEASMEPSLRSILPRCTRSAARVCKITSKRPSRCHC